MAHKHVPVPIRNVLDKIDKQGFALIENFLSPQQLETLKMEAEVIYELSLEGRHGAAVDNNSRWGAESNSSCIYEGVPGHLCTPAAKHSYDAYKAQRTAPPLGAGTWRIIFESQLAELVLGVLGPDAVLFNEQYIMKPPLSPLSSFRWHRDSDWCRTAEVEYRPYISVWIALDDMTADNGCFVVAPGSHLRDLAGRAVQQGQQILEQQQGQQQQQQQAQEQGQRMQQQAQEQEQRIQQQQQQIVYGVWQQAEGQQLLQSGCSGTLGGRGEQDTAAQGLLQHAQQLQALPLQVRAGTAVITSDTVLHCSGPNSSRHMRRAWMPQFSAGPIKWTTNGRPVGLAVPLMPPHQQLPQQQQ